ncbi:Urea ABC transporter, urea binding protein [Rubellimicrobium mesophilum DSM 19309]|uniref:Urea ABC transporter, urea binding protein n=1 Tax=Rubellimicrobium mesophilum DSM 19309 TaxID=442562 RepID=A0A017HJG9_9RHOB|nr:transporter substrate-binding protein [Rubellimicrobium mesophilum]EYD73929.1 Urea ABC transporter, urea binding protein [Rubellimicrobium mesophilum DSM 19309]
MQRVEIGLLFSRSGSYRLLAEACRAGALRAIAEVNADPALGLELVPVERDPGGEADAYAPLCAEILSTSTARHVVGCVTSWSRKEVIPALERLGGFLWYPCPYEGFEASGQVAYAHACPNQHLVPLLRWAFARHGRRGYLTGSNYIWGWEVNRVARGLIGEAGGEVLGERYLPIGDTDVGRMVEEIRATRPDFVLNNLIGASSYEFVRALRRLAEEDARFAPERCPVLSCNLTECELPALGGAAEGLVSAGPYFRGGAGRFGSSFEAAAFASVRSLAARLARAGDAGASLDDLLDLPDGGELRIDPATHHATLPVVIAQVEGGAFRVRERWEAVPADPYLARRERLAMRPHLRAVTP